MIYKERLNAGKPAGIFIAVVAPGWVLAKISETEYKVYAHTDNPVKGKANYGFFINGTAINLHAAKDCFKLRDERPALFTAIEAYLRAKDVVVSENLNDTSDPYGDVCMTRKQKLSPEQTYKRALIGFRRQFLEALSCSRHTEWEVAIRYAHDGAFKEKISEERYRRDLAWVTAHRGSVSVEALRQVERDYYDGKYAPHRLSTLEGQLAMLSGLHDPQPVSETIEDLL